MHLVSTQRLKANILIRESGLKFRNIYFTIKNMLGKIIPNFVCTIKIIKPTKVVRKTIQTCNCKLWRLRLICYVIRHGTKKKQKSELNSNWKWW